MAKLLEFIVLIVIYSMSLSECTIEEIVTEYSSESEIEELYPIADYMYPNMSFLELEYNPDNAIPKELENVLEQVVLNGELKDFVEKYEAEYVQLLEKDLQEYMQKDSAGVLCNYYYTDGQKTAGEEYFLFQNTGDIIVRQPSDAGHYIYYKFQYTNINDSTSYKHALRALGYNTDFWLIEWEETNYLITTRGEGDERGVAVYCMGAENIYGWLLYLEEENGVVNKRYYTYVSNGIDYMGSYWPGY